ncbi:MAG TPA: thioredoxin family protein [Bacteroidales bacterium]|jgi:small redox-active disulfide protein 2|nr:thioredoxin family protein [Bacteroidales bacterium]
MNIEIKILGASCGKCKKLERITNEVITENKFNANVAKIVDLSQIMAYGYLNLPAFVINEKVIFKGIVPSKNQIKDVITNFIN